VGFTPAQLKMWSMLNCGGDEGGTGNVEGGCETTAGGEVLWD
jgi:hypothetical protein